MRQHVALGTLLLLLSVSCSPPRESMEATITVQGVEFSAEELEEVLTLSPLPSNPPNPNNQVADLDSAKHLGQLLFYETRLSKDQKVSCATCHQPDRDWTDGEKVSLGLERVTRNSPTLYNLAHNRWYFWDGRKDSIWSQSLGPIENAKEMGGSRVQTYHLIAEDTELRTAYETVFGPFPSLQTTDPPKAGYPNPESPKDPHHIAWNRLTPADQETINRLFANLGKAIEAFERQLISKDSPFDHFVAALRKDRSLSSSPLSDSAVRGLKLFIDQGQCTFCHSGPNFTDLEFHNIGLDRGELGLDTGRFDAVKKVKRDPFNGLGAFSDAKEIEENKSLFFLAQKPNNLGEFKTPTLRNISGTAPYMHDGRFETLREVVEFYSTLDQTPALGHREETLQPLALTEPEITDLLAFLDSLTGAPLAPHLLQPPGQPQTEH